MEQYINKDDMDKIMITLNYGYGTEQISVQKLLNQRNSLIVENSQLKNQLYNNTRLFEDTRSILTNRIDDLLKQIEYLTKQNEELRSKLEDKDIKELKIRVDSLSKDKESITIKLNELLKDKEDRKNIMITAESVILFDRIITNHIFDYENSHNLSDIVYEKTILDENEYKRWCIFKNELGIDPKDLLWYLSRLKDERNAECHDKYKLTIDMIKNIMIRYVETNKDKKHFKGYNKVIDFLVKKLKDVKGTNPFKISEEAPEI